MKVLLWIVLLGNNIGMNNIFGMNNNLCVNLRNMIVSGGKCRILLVSRGYTMVTYHV